MTSRQHAALWVVLLAGIATYQWVLISNADGQLFAPEVLDGTFNSMLLHLLHGSVEVSRSAIGFESFTREGRTYAYFGIVPALMRLPALPFASDPEHMHLARLSCVAGATALAGLTLRTLLEAHRSLPPAQRSPALVLCAAAATALGGPQLFVANAGYVYNEPAIWGAVLVASSTLIVVRAVLANRFLSGRELCWFGGLAGLAINTRATSGVDIGTGFGLILMYGVTMRLRGGTAYPSWRATALATAFAATGLMIACVINTARFGDPLNFQDFNFQDMLHRHPHRLDMFRLHGAFNLARMPTSLLYFTTGLTFVLKYSGPLGGWLGDMYDGIEGPPTSPLLTNPLWTVMAIIGLVPALRRSVLTAAALAGHVVAALFLLCLMYLALRYRLDLNGLLVLPAVFGMIGASRWLSGARHRTRTIVTAGIIAVSVLGVIAALYVLLMAKIMNFAAPVEVRCGLQRFAPFVPVTITAEQKLPSGCIARR
jgi:hypothetical protein